MPPRGLMGLVTLQPSSTSVYRVNAVCAGGELLVVRFFKRGLRLKKRSNALRGGPRRFAARAVKVAGFAFIEAK